MVAKSKWRGHDIELRADNCWYYSDTLRPVHGEPDRVCGHCAMKNRDDGCDPCIGALPGVSNACCGHGNPSDAYIQFENGVTVRGFKTDKREAKEEQL